MRVNKSQKMIFSLVIFFMIVFTGASYADFTYTVKSGDSLYIIANSYSSTVSGIMTRNGLTTTSLNINQKLVIPTSKYTEYTVVSGDSLWKISQRFGVTITDIQKYNPTLNISNLYVGTKIILPVTSVAPTPITQYRTHTVVAGDNLWMIATKYNVTEAGIKSLNGLTTNVLSIGQVLKIPASPTYVIDSALAAKLIYFPMKSGYQIFDDNYGAGREFAADGTIIRGHTGLDINAPLGTPVYSVGSGVITRKGWEDLGGYRMMIQLDGSSYATYYAHLSRYADNMYVGKNVAAGELIGYVGNTGYGPEGTTGKFPTHLHIGIYTSSSYSSTINPYPYMKKLLGQSY